MGAVKEWGYGWVNDHIEENDNGTATVTLDDSDIRLHFASAEKAETYLWENEVDRAFADMCASVADDGKNRRKYGDL